MKFNIYNCVKIKINLYFCGYIFLRMKQSYICNVIRGEFYWEERGDRENERRCYKYRYKVWAYLAKAIKMVK